MHKLIVLILIVFSVAVLYCQSNLVSGKISKESRLTEIQSNIIPENNNVAAQPEQDITDKSQNIEAPKDGTRLARTASVSGNWSNTATWGGLSVPVAGDAVTINPGITVTVTAAAACTSITFAAVTTSSAITISGTNTLTVSGAVSMPRPSTGQTCTINVNAGSMSIGTTLTMGATVTARNNVFNVTTGTLTIAGNITCGTTGCIFNISSTGTISFGGTFSSIPTLTTVTGSTVNYTGGSAQTILAKTYSGNLGLSGAGTKTIAASATVTVNGNITNSSTLVLTAGTETTSTWLVMGGNLTNTGILTATADYIRFIFSSANAQTFTNNGTVTSPISSFDVSNASGLTLVGTGFNVTRANLFTGVVTNSNKITLGTGGASYAVVQRGVDANTTPAGSFNVAPNFNVGSGGLALLYDNGSVAYSTGYEVPSSNTCDLLYIFDAADISLSSDLTISSELNFYGGIGTPILRIGAHTLTLGGTITYTVAGSFYGGGTSNLIMNGSTTLNTITNGLNNLIVNNASGVNLGGAVTVNGTLTLTDGALANSTYLTMASGATISRTATGTLTAAPSFAGTVNVVYTGSSAVASGFELPSSSSVLYNLTTNSSGVTQSVIPAGGTVSTLYTQGFNAAPADWTTEVVTNPTGTAPTISYVTSAASTYPTVAFTEGGIGVQFNSYNCESGDQIRLKKNSSPLATTGKTNVTVVFDWYMDTGFSTSNDYVTVQWSTNGTSWTSSSVYYRYSATNGWITNSCVLPTGAENQSTLYVAFLFTSLYGNNCHLDNMKLNVTTPGTPTPSTTTVNGTLNLVGNYTIGSNTLTMANNATINRSDGALSAAPTFGANVNLIYSGTNAITTAYENPGTGVINFTVSNTSTGGASLGVSTAIGGTLYLTPGNLTIGAYTLTVNNTISTGGGTLIGGTSSDMTCNTTTPGTIPPVVDVLTVNPGSSNVTVLPNDVVVNDLTISTGSLGLNGNSLTFAGDDIVFDSPDAVFSSLTTSLDTTAEVVFGNTSIARVWHTDGTMTNDVDITFTYPESESSADPLYAWTRGDDNIWVSLGTFSPVDNGSTRSITIPTVVSVTGSAKGDRDWTFTEDDSNTPVELSSFTATLSVDSYVNLMWVTQSETGVQGYYILRNTSEDLASALVISDIIAATNTAQQQSYVYHDTDLFDTGTYYYWLQNTDLDGTTAYHGPTSVVYNPTGGSTPPIPFVTGLGKVYPNPFNPLAYIPYSLDENTEVSFEIFNTRGQLVRSLSVGNKTPGNYQIEWNGLTNLGTTCSTGVYYIRMYTNKASFTRRAVLMK